jgi:hypothetical protein
MILDAAYNIQTEKKATANQIGLTLHLDILPKISRRPSVPAILLVTINEERSGPKGSK